ncbi:hypothetical protein LIER_39865 [Lithospermum erythrorhizon]|uniref:DUF241 domain protein n=1 Tax=Lithospermum erythrorhizon TaxID=34254 RepID=A0AAV3QLA8_LITER
MATKMVANFRRSLSFPNHPNSTPKPKKTFHVRSASLPCRSHPLISQLKDEINELKSYVITTNQETRSTAWLCDCLIRLKAVHESLDDLMQLPQTRDSLSGDNELVENILEDFLKFVDVYGIFQSLILTMKEEHLAAQVALRKKDDAKMVLYLKGLKKIAKEMERVEETIQCIGNYHIAPASSTFQVGDIDAEIIEAIKDVAEVTIVISNALFKGISLSLTLRKCSWVGLSIAGKSKRVRAEEGIQEFLHFGFDNLTNLKKKGDEDFKLVVKKMRNLEDCIVSIEIGSDKVFRSLINSRVSLLNVLT